MGVLGMPGKEARRQRDRKEKGEGRKVKNWQKRVIELKSAILF